MDFSPIFPSSSSHKEEIIFLKDIYEYGFLKWTLLNFSPNVCNIKKNRWKNNDEMIIYLYLKNYSKHRIILLF